MCSYSMIADNFRDRWTKPGPYISPFPPIPAVNPGAYIQGVNREEFDALKRELEILKSLLQAAKEYDKRNGEPDCEMESKVKFLREVAKAVGVNLEDVLESETKEKSS